MEHNVGRRLQRRGKIDLESLEFGDCTVFVHNRLLGKRLRLIAGMSTTKGIGGLLAETAKNRDIMF